MTAIGTFITGLVSALPVEVDISEPMTGYHLVFGMDSDVVNCQTYAVSIIRRS